MNENEAPVIEIKSMLPGDWPSVRQIYGEGIEGRNATFETALPSWAEWDSHHREDARLVAFIENEIVGWSSLSPISARRVYAGVAEVSVYVDQRFHNRGVGLCLLEALIQRSEELGIWTLQASIFPENVPSLSLHKKLGFREVGIRERIAQLDGTWRDTILLERRSPIIGVVEG
jgi:L-amino acid N-acyltransferase YncA